MKKILKKNQVIITILVVMVAAAGYLNYSGTRFASVSSTDDAQTAETADLDAVREEIDSLDMDLTDETALLAENQESVSEESTASELQEENQNEETLETAQADESTDEDTAVPGEAVLTSTAAAAYVSQARVEREQVRSQNKEALMEIINNSELTQEEIQNAVDSMVELTDITEKETAAETLLEAKGFTNAIVNMSGDTVDVIVDAAALDDASRAQIEDVVIRKTGASIENIVITPVTTVTASAKD